MTPERRAGLGLRRWVGVESRAATRIATDPAARAAADALIGASVLCPATTPGLQHPFFKQTVLDCKIRQFMHS
jgi:hypothetical protein